MQDNINGEGGYGDQLKECKFVEIEIVNNISLFLTSLFFCQDHLEDATDKALKSYLKNQQIFFMRLDLCWSHLMAKIGITQEIEQRPIEILKKQLIKHNCALRI